MDITRRAALASMGARLGCAVVPPIAAAQASPSGAGKRGALTAGVALSALEGTPESLPGSLNGTVFVTPESHYRYYAAMGLDHVRLQGLWERLQPELGGALGEQLLDGGSAEELLRNPVALVFHHLEMARRCGLSVVLDLCHNYGRRAIGYRGTWASKREALLGSSDLPIPCFTDYCVKLVRTFGDHPAVAAIELMNEPHDLEIGPSGWADACQQAIDAIRTISRSIPIVVDGYSWSSAENWSQNNPTLHSLRDPSNRLIFSAHQYFDRRSAGTYPGAEATASPPDPEIGVRRVEPFVRWLASHGLSDHGMLGEFGAPDTAGWAEIVRRTILFASQAGLGLTDHVDIAYPDDPYVMNQYPARGKTDRYVTLLMSSAAGDGRRLRTVIEPLALACTPVIPARVHLAYEGFTVSGTGGTAPYRYVVAEGTLPSGLSLDAATGLVAGTPARPGEARSIVLRVIDTHGEAKSLAPFDLIVT